MRNPAVALDQKDVPRTRSALETATPSRIPYGFATGNFAQHGDAGPFQAKEMQ
jgi:hypothetical protein